MFTFSPEVAASLEARGLDHTIDAHTLAAAMGEGAPLLDASEVDAETVATGEPSLAPGAPGSATGRTTGGSAVDVDRVLDRDADRLALELGEMIGEGGMGCVRRAAQTSIGRDVAVKGLKPHFAGDTGHTRALVREGLLTGRLEHPNIVPIHAVNLDDGGEPLIVMKRIEGESWRALLKAEARTGAGALVDERLRHNLEIFVQVCRALEFAHSRGTVHRDMKPENVMVGDFGEVYVVDWGIALHHHAESGQRSGPVGFVGTPVYLAPEMLTGDFARVDGRTDVYLLGATLFEVLSGDAPHAGHEGLAPMLLAISETEFVAVPEALGVHDELAAIVERATARDPSARFPNVAALREAVEAYVRHRGSLSLTDAADAARTRFEALLAEAGEAPSETRRRAIFEAFSEANLGYRGARHEWPENARAERGLQQTLEAMCRHALATDQPELADSLLGQMPRRSGELVEAAAAVRAAIEKRRAATSQLAALEAERSLQKSGKSLLVLLYGVLGVGALATVGLVMRAGSLVVPVTSAETIALVSTLGAVMGISVAVFWKRLNRSRASRQLLVGVGLIFAFMVTHRIAAAIAGTAPEIVLGQDMWVEAMAFAVGSLSMGRWLGYAALAMASFAAVATLAPPYAPFLFGISQVLVPAVAIPAYLRRLRDDEAKAGTA